MTGSSEQLARPQASVALTDLHTFQELPHAALVLHPHHHRLGGDGRQVTPLVLLQICLGAIWAQQLQVLQLQIQGPGLLVLTCAGGERRFVTLDSNKVQRS